MVGRGGEFRDAARSDWPYESGIMRTVAGPQENLDQVLIVYDKIFGAYGGLATIPGFISQFLTVEECFRKSSLHE